MSNKLKVISGGQTGADRTALEIAHDLGYETGGLAPKGYRTERGPDMELKTKFHLAESRYPEYSYRTRQNVRAADITIWFGKVDSPGFKATNRAAGGFRRALIINPDAFDLLQLLRDDKIAVINIAGNRLSTNPNIIKQVQDVLGEALSRYKKPLPNLAEGPCASDQQSNQSPAESETTEPRTEQ